MSFYTDNQTREELNLTGKYRPDSVFHVFNYVKSRGGAKLLEELFRHPLCDETAINQRSSTIRYFQQVQVAFSFDSSLLNEVREYLDGHPGGNGFLNILDLFWRKALSLLVHDDRLKKIIRGLQATVVTLQHCRQFVHNLPEVVPEYAARLAEMQQLLNHPMVISLIEIDIYSELSLAKLARCDSFLRNTFRTGMENILAFIAEADVYISVGHAAGKYQLAYCEALPAAENQFHAENLRHPALAGAVSNSVSQDGHRHVLFLTGANMAGKSTLMKAVGIALYLAHMGFPVAASRLVFSVREGLYTSINTPDNIGLGYSHFYAEVMRVKEAAEAVASGKRLFLIFDELFKGTNVKDAYDGTLAVTQAFAEYSNCLFIISTHIIEVGEAMANDAYIQFAYLPTILEDGKPKYTYRLQPGITEDRQGMMILRNEGILARLDGE